MKPTQEMVDAAVGNWQGKWWLKQDEPRKVRSVLKEILTAALADVKVVPREPTKKMLEEGTGLGFRYDKWRQSEARITWQDMWDAYDD